MKPQTHWKATGENAIMWCLLPVSCINRHKTYPQQTHSLCDTRKAARLTGSNSASPAVYDQGAAGFQDYTLSRCEV